MQRKKKSPQIHWLNLQNNSLHTGEGQCLQCVQMSMLENPDSYFSFFFFCKKSDWDWLTLMRWAELMVFVIRFLYCPVIHWKTLMHLMCLISYVSHISCERPGVSFESRPYRQRQTGRHRWILLQFFQKVQFAPHVWLLQHKTTDASQGREWAGWVWK